MENKNQPPEYINTILQNQNIVFKTKSEPSFSTNQIKFFGVLATVIIVLISIFFTKNYLKNSNQNFELNSTFLENNIQLLLPVLIATLVLIISIYLISKIQIKKNTNNKYFPWFIGADNFLLIASESDSVPIPWNFLSTEITNSKKPKGNINITFARKEFSIEAKKHFPSLIQNYKLNLKNIKDPEFISQICKTKISK